jgi:hypothetical protein
MLNPLARGALLSVAFLLPGCGAEAYSEEEVKTAFAKQKLHLGEVTRSESDENPLDVILALSHETESCPRTDLVVNVFETVDALERFLERTYGRVPPKRRRSGDALVLVERNLLIGVRTTSPCVRSPDVDAAIASLE